MGSDSILNNSVPAFSKKKRTNRLAKLKQSKLDVRREQWLSQVKKKESKVNLNERSESLSPPFMRTDERNKPLESLEMRSKEENEGLSIHDSDMESLASSPICSSLGHNNSSKDLHGSSSSSISSGCCSESISEEEEEEDNDTLDDWEAVADALTADEKQHNPISEPPAVEETRVTSIDPDLQNNDSVVDCTRMESKNTAPRSRAWRPDDASRPEGLPNLLKQHSFPAKSDRHAIPWSWRNMMSQPSCPICCEDLDLTDSSFLPCSCGFRLCLFCHKRILEADGRCPGCRKTYDSTDGGVVGLNGGSAPFRMARSCSMTTRS